MALCEHRKRKAPYWVPVGDAIDGTFFAQCPCCGDWRQMLAVASREPALCSACAPVSKRGAR